MCQVDETLKDEFGCETPTQTPVWEDAEENKYYSCPIKYLNACNSVIEWYNEYAYMLEFGVAKEYGEQSNKFIAYKNIYKMYMNHYQKLKEKPNQLQKMKSAWQKNK